MVKDKNIRKKLFKYSYNQKQITTCSALFVLCANLNIEEIINNYRNMSKPYYNTQQLEKRISFLENFLKSKTRKELFNYFANQVYIALMNALNAATSLGLNSCPMTGFKPEKYSEVLNLSKDIVPVVLVPVGYSKIKPKDKMRYSIKDILIRV